MPTLACLNGQDLCKKLVCSPNLWEYGRVRLEVMQPGAKPRLQTWDNFSKDSLLLRDNLTVPQCLQCCLHSQTTFLSRKWILQVPSSSHALILAHLSVGAFFTFLCPHFQAGERSSPFSLGEEYYSRIWEATFITNVCGRGTVWADLLCQLRASLDLALHLLTRREYLLQPQREFKGLGLYMGYFWATRHWGKLKIYKFSHPEI